MKKDYRYYLVWGNTELINEILKLQNSKVNETLCPLCDCKLQHETIGEFDTHAYICPECSFVGFEYLNINNVNDIINRLKK